MLDQQQLKLFKVLSGIIIFCVLSILIINHCLTLSTSFKENLTATFIGSGILGGIVAILVFYLQESDEYQANKAKAKSFLEQKLMLDIQEVIDRGPSLWNLSGGKKFYFDGSLINSFFDVYEENFDQINNYHAYFPENKLVRNYDEFYRTARKGYLYGEKMDNLIYQVVRADHHKRGLISANDPITQCYLKGKLFTDMSEEELCKYLEWKQIPTRATELHTSFIDNADVKSLVSKIKEIREELLKKVKNLEKSKGEQVL